MVMSTNAPDISCNPLVKSHTGGELAEYNSQKKCISWYHLLEILEA